MDWFDHRDPQSQYFLSHAHTDHFSFNEFNETEKRVAPTGLLSKEFKLTKKQNVKIYCTEVTRDIIQKYSQEKNLHYEEIRHHIEILEVGEQRDINMIDEDGHESGEKITVTTIPANHIPGAVMFLFEDGEKRAFYTGDFRYDVREDNKEMKQLKDFVENYDEIIDYLYVDITCLDIGKLYHSDQNKLPTRQESKDMVRKLIETKKPKNIHIDTSMIGSEDMAKAVAEATNNSAEDIFSRPCGNGKSMARSEYLLKGIKEIPQANLACKSKLHISQTPIFKDACKRCDSSTLRIRATLQKNFCAPSYSLSDKNTWKIYDQYENFWTVLCSHHSSDQELREFLSRLRFKKIFPISEHFYRGDSDKLSVMDSSWEDTHHLIKKSLYFTLESETLDFSDVVLDVLWLTEKNQHDEWLTKINEFMSKPFKIKVEKCLLKDEIFQVISNSENPIDIIIIPCASELKQSLDDLDSNLDDFIKDLKLSSKKVLFVSATSNEDEEWKECIAKYRNREGLQTVFYLDLSTFKNPVGGESADRYDNCEIILDALKNLVINSDKKYVGYDDWPMPYEYSTRKKQYEEHRLGNQPEIQE